MKKLFLTSLQNEKGLKDVQYINLSVKRFEKMFNNHNLICKYRTQIY